MNDSGSTGVSRLDGVPRVSFGIDRNAAALAGRRPLRLDDLHTDHPPPRAAIDATCAAIGQDSANSYLPLAGDPRLREAVSAQIARRSGEIYDPGSEILITCGASEGITDALLATVEAGDEVLLTDPTYAGMVGRVRMLGAVPRFVPFRLQDRRWRLDLDALRAAASKRTRMLFLMNPSIPTGAVLDDEEWDAVARVCADHHAWLLYNAAHEGIVFDGQPIRHPASIPELRPWLINAGSISKERRMIGWRVGWVATDVRIAADIALVHANNVVAPPGISQAGARAAIESPASDLADAVAEWQRRRDALVDGLADLSPVPAAGGWSMLVDVGRLGLQPSAVTTRLLEHDVVVVPMDGWGESVSTGYIRLVFSAEPVERLRLAVDRMRDLLLT